MASPVLSGFDGATFAENTVNAAPQIIDGDVTLTDANGDWTGNQLVVSGLLAEDVVSVQSSGPIDFDSSTGDIRYNGVIIGNGVAGAGTFTITFDSDATGAGVEAVIEHLTYANTSDSPTATRSLTLKVGAPALVERTGAANPVDGVASGAYGHAVFADLDGDGDQDMWIGHSDGQEANYFENVGGAFFLRDTAANPIGAFPAVQPAPSFGDLDGDGDLDMIMGGFHGYLFYYQNDGTAAAPAFVDTHMFEPFPTLASVGNFSSPQMIDIDADGDLDVIAGNYDGAVVFYRNEGAPNNPSLVLVDGGASPFAAINIDQMSRPAMADIDGDGDLDLVVGMQSGALRYWENTGTAAAASFAERVGAANPFDGVNLGSYSAPTFVDLDGDGDQDLVVDGADGVLRYYENLTPAPLRIDVAVTSQGETIVGGSSDEDLHGSAEGELIQGLDGDDLLDGGDGDDALEGGQGDDYLRGGAGADAMFGGSGNDTYVIDDSGDTTDETGGDGIDLVWSRISWTLGADIENLTLGAAGGNINGYGNGLDNVITGNAATNQIWGDFGADTLNGGGGHDNLFGGFGADILDGGNGNDALYGEGDTDALVGGAGMDVLDGGFGDDYMAGGTGNDAYFVDSILDEVVEDANGGTDIVFASVDWTLGDNVENLSLTGSNSVSGTGNALKNVIIGNDEYNSLYGDDGADTLSGMGGDDMLLGEAGNDILDGGGGADQMFGGYGSDRMTGGLGADDFYFSDNDIQWSTLGAVAERDTILDFVKGEDEIYLYFIDANVNVAGDQDFTLVSRLSGQAGQAVLRYTAASDTTTAEFDVDGDGKADFRLTVNGNHVADHGDWHF